VLHYTGGDDDRGGIISVVRNLSAAGNFRSWLGVNEGATQTRRPPLPALEFPRVAGERISPANAWRARRVADAVQAWLAASPQRLFHGHSRAGLLVALWLQRRGERRVVVSVHCYGRQRWFYRWAARRLGQSLIWLSPAMRDHYGVVGNGWAGCRPGCVAADRPVPLRAPRVGFVLRLGGIGALVRWKRWDLVLAALDLLPGEIRRQIRFRHLGAAENSEKSRAYAAELRAAAAARGLEVAWEGQQPSSEGFLKEVDVLVVASQDEPFSVAMLEALYAGVPVLAADSGGARDVIEPGVNGWLFRSGDAGDLAARLAAIVAGADLTGKDAVAASLQRFSAHAAAEEWHDLYRAALGRAPTVS